MAPLIRPLPVLPFSGLGSTVTPLGVLDGVATHARADWRSGVSVTTRWATERTFSSVSGQEQRVGSLLRPTRAVSSRHVAFGVDYDFALQHAQRLVQRAPAPPAGQLARAGLDRVAQAPLASDCTLILGTAPSGANLRLLCDTRYTRFFVGGRVYLSPPTPTVMTYSGERFTAVVANIVAVDPDYLDISTPVVVPVGGWLAEPVLDVEVQLSSTVRNITARVAELEFDVLEVMGSSALPPEELEPGAQYHTGRDGVARPVYYFDHNWQNALEWSNVADGQGYGNNGQSWVAGLKPKRSTTASARFLSRGAYWPLLQLFDSMRGRAGVFWAVFPEVLFADLPVTPGASSITFPAQGRLAEWRTIVDAFAVIQGNGTITIHETLIPTDNGDGTWTLPIDPALPSVPFLRCVHLASRARFNTDELTESWQTREVLDVTVPILELGLPTNLQLLTP